MAMSSEIMHQGSSRFISSRSWSETYQPYKKFFRLSQLRKLRGCEEVAAVCYRIRRRSIEFLLVQTRGGRWTFPKGGTEPGLTQAQAAAIEAFEEAGVHGRMEEVSFARYLKDRSRARPRASGIRKSAVNAYLCEVLRLSSPQEPKRNRTWFSPDKAKRRLREGRKPDYGSELARVVDRATDRIQRLRYANGMPIDAQPTDALQKVQFTIEAPSPIINTAKSISNVLRKRPKIFYIDQF
jgi:8-oxo-dGTP pyrophosphatase MutT (NUDIX family)